MEAFQRAMRLSPLDPWTYSFAGGLALAHLIAGRYKEAIEWADRALHEQPRMTHVTGFKAVACSCLGRVAEAGQRIRRFCELRPGSTVATVEEAMGTVFAPDVLAIYLEGLRKAGLPEK
jgi:adenylate cyclase